MTYAIGDTVYYLEGYAVLSGVVVAYLFIDWDSDVNLALVLDADHITSLKSDLGGEKKKLYYISRDDESYVFVSEELLGVSSAAVKALITG